MLVAPGSKKSLDFLNSFNFTTKIENFGKIWVVDAGYTFDLTVFYFVTVISTFDTASCVFFAINLSAVALSVLGESFNCSNSLS